MEKLTDLVRTMGDMPIAYLAVFLGFGAMALAAYAIHKATTKDR